MLRERLESRCDMPELPEVETVRRSLELRLVGKRINDVKVYYDNIIAYPNVSDFKTLIVGQKINGMKRYGKWLMFLLDDYYLLSHLRMEGKYFFKDINEEVSKHEHVSFLLDDGLELRYHDVRKFGKMHLIKKENIDKEGPLVEMGLEPWDKKLDIVYLRDKFKNKKLPIKSVLLDQSIIVGIGNIYANEILFLSSISPLKKASLLNDDELSMIIVNTKKILEKAIKSGGTTIRSYTSIDGVHGRFQHELYVHSKEGCQCVNCGDIIMKIKVGGRGTYYCPSCQKFD